MTLEKILLGRFPIMLKSKLCILNGLADDVCFNLGECKNDKEVILLLMDWKKLLFPKKPSLIICFM